MMPSAIGDFLSRARVPYTVFRHRPAFGAQRDAAVSHVPGYSWAKTVVCVADGAPVLAVVPAPCTVDLERLRILADARTLRLAREEELAALYPECEPGAMPPFGTLYQQRVFIDESFVGEPEMVFNAGTHTEAIRMHFADLAELANAIVGTLAGPSLAPARGDA